MTRTSSSIAFIDVVAQLWERRRMLIAFVAVAAILGVVIALVLRPKYEATVVLMPAETLDARSGLGALGGRLSDLADIAGLGSAASGGLEKAIAVLSSRDFTDRFLQDEKILPVLFADDWDEARQAWKKTPSSWDAFKLFDRMRVIGRDRKTGVITVSISWRDPEQAALWANQLVVRANDEMRTRALDDSQRSLGYLTEQAQKTSPIEVRDVLYRLIEAEQRKAMLAQVRQRGYAFEVVDPAVPPKERVSPRRTLLVLGFMIAGFLLGIATVLAQSMLRAGRK